MSIFMNDEKKNNHFLKWLGSGMMEVLGGARVFLTDGQLRTLPAIDINTHRQDSTFLD